MDPAVIRPDEAGRSGLRPVGRVALPLAVETAAWAVAADDDLVVLVNRPGTTQTRRLRLCARGAGHLPAFTAEGAALPLVAAGAAAHGGTLLVTGADREGRAVVLGAAADGPMAWHFGMTDSRPIRWPVPGRAWRAVVAWQETAAALEVADVQAGGLSGRRTVPVGGPLPGVALGAGAVWAVWSTPQGIECLEVREHDVRQRNVVAALASGLAVGADGTAAWVAWTAGRGCWLARLAPHAAGSASPLKLDLGAAHGGRLALRVGAEPLVWSQCADTAEAPRWTSTLALPGRQPLTIDGFVHAVAWWGDRVAVVDTHGVHLLQHER